MAKNLKLILSLAGSLVFHGSVQAQQIYHCVIEHSSGKRETIYSQQPCAREAKTVSVTKDLPTNNSHPSSSLDDLNIPQSETSENITTTASVAVGMTPDQVRQTWGTPTSVNFGKGPNGQLEQWVYEDTEGQNSNGYVYFNDGVVDSYTDPRPKK
jgi:hypothetical protein